MRNSDIFNGFAKIAQEKGIISNDSGKAAKELSKTHRADSLSISAIQALYGVKNEMPKAMSYDKNIMESAHANNVIISPAYDKLNSLFENNIERQNILLKIVNKNPDGLLTQRKYAKNDLILSLVRVANDLDNNDKDQLRALADSCLYSLKKEAFAHWGLAGLVAAAMTIFYALPRINNASAGFDDLHKDLIKQLKQLIDGEITLGVGIVLNSNGKDMVNNVITQLGKIKSAYDGSLKTIREAFTPLTRNQLLAEVNQHENIEKYEDLTNKYSTLNEAIANIKPMLTTLKELFENKTLLATLIDDKGALTNAMDFTQILHGGYGFIPNNFDDVVIILPAYLKSLSEILNAMEVAKLKIERMPSSTSEEYRGFGQSSSPSSTSGEYRGLDRSGDPSRNPSSTSEEYLGLDQDRSGDPSRNPSSTSKEYGGLGPSRSPSSTSREFRKGPSTTSKEFNRSYQPGEFEGIKIY